MATALEVRNFTNAKLMQLIKGNPEKSRVMLANLRDGVNWNPGELSKLWEPVFKGMPEDMMSRSGEPSYAEWAVYIALTMFAVHQQGKDIEKSCMHKDGVSLGAAMGKLVTSPEDAHKIMNRFNAICSASDIDWFASQLQRGISLLKSSGIPLDYAKLAEDIFELQFEDGEERVKLSWGQDFYRQLNNNACSAKKGKAEKGEKP